MSKLLLIFVLFFSLTLKGQLKVDTAYSIEYLIDKVLVGKGIRVGNILLNGHKVGLGYFQSDSAVIGMNSGILLSTGSVFDATGENNTPGMSGALFNYGTATKNKRSKRGDRDLNKICRGRTHDVNIIEFDFVPFHNNVSFNYCFASEEYKEYVGSRFNDVFAFIVKGPGLRKTNIAVLPNTKEPITINNVNHKKNKNFFINNDYFVNVGLFKNVNYQPKVSIFRKIWIWLFKKKHNEDAKFYTLDGEKKKLNQVLVNGFQYDGFTKVFKANFYVEPFQKYHLKIAIGDAGDAIFDSGVFLEEGSFSSLKDMSVEDFKDYKDISQTLDFDSIFGLNQPIVDTIIEEDFEITDVYFGNDQYAIPDSAKPNLDKLAIYLLDNPKLKCELWGYTDNKGSKNYNQKLSEKRAIQVMYYLISKGVSRRRMEYQGNNFSTPIADNKTLNGRARNRRVEIIIIE